MKLKILISFLILGMFTRAQSPFKFSPAVDVPIVTIGFGTALTGLILEKKSAEPTLASFQNLDRMSIGKFDRSATYNWNPKAAHWSDAIMYGAIASPLLFLGGERSRKDFLTAGSISAEVFLLNTGVTFLTKALVKRKRPYVYNPNAPLEEKLKKDSRHSFFSGHTSTVASMSFSFAMMHSFYYPNSRIKPLVWFAAAVLPMTTAILRVRAGKHFWTDVLVGYGAGMSIGVGVPLLHRIKSK